MPKRITLNLTEQQHADLTRMAEEMGITLNALVCVCCWSWLRENDTEKRRED